MESMLKLQAKYGQDNEAISARQAVARTALEELEDLLRQHPVRVVRVEPDGIGLDCDNGWIIRNPEAWKRVAKLFWGDAFDAFVDKYEQRLPIRLSKPHGSSWR
jgi:hypothetical protein